MAKVQYDPRACGALCDKCPLYGKVVVPPNGPEDAEFVVVAEAPGPTEERVREPLVGPSGRVLDTALSSAGLPRNQVRATNVLLCRPHFEGDLTAMLKDIAKQNKAIVRGAKEANRRNKKDYKEAEKAQKKVAQQAQKIERAATRAEARWRADFVKAWKAYEKDCKAAKKLAAKASPGAPIPWPTLPPVPPRPEAVAVPVVPTIEYTPVAPEEVTPDLILSPIDCCRPRLLHDLQHARTVLMLGAHAMQAVVGADAVGKISDEQGFPIDLKGKHPKTQCGVATVHPAALMRGMTQYSHAWMAWVGRAVRYHRMGVHWTQPNIIYDQVEVGIRLGRLLKVADEALAQDPECKGKPAFSFAFDVETSGIDVAISHLRVLSLAFDDHTVLVIPVRLIDGRPHRNGIVWSRLCRIMAHPKVYKIAHHGVFDRSVMQMNDCPVLPPCGDTLLQHHTDESEAPHSLSFLSSVLLDGPSWKGLGDGTHGMTVQDDKQLWEYNGHDTHRTILIYPYLDCALKEAGQHELYRHMMELQDAVVDMTCNGMPINEKKRIEFIDRFRQLEQKHLDEVLTIIKETGVDFEGEEVNPNSGQQMAKVLVAMGVELPETDSGQLSTAEEVITQAVLAPGVGSQAVKFVGTKLSPYKDGSGLLGYRSVQKARATFLENLQIASDGCIRSSWKMHGTPNGRFSSADPNFQNIPEWLRAVYEAPDGWEFVAADYSALELWVVASYTQCSGLKRALESPDPHLVNAQALFQFDFAKELLNASQTGCPVHGKLRDSQVQLVAVDAKGNPTGEALNQVKLAQWKPHYENLSCPACLAASEQAAKEKAKRLKDLRGLAKGFVYAVNYQAAPSTIWARLLPDAPDLQIGEVEALVKRWNTVNPEIAKTAQRNFDQFIRARLEGKLAYIESPFLGRRRYWSKDPQGFKITDAANYPIQSGAGDITNQALVNLYPTAKKLGAKLVAQVHDSIVFLSPIKVADEIEALLHKEMPGPWTLRGDKGSVRVPIESKRGPNWAAVGA